MSVFRIIALRVFDGCPEYLYKALETNHTYFFFDGYEYVEREDYIQKKDNYIEPLHIYDVKGEGDHIVNVEVSAIVGKNGEGKSSLVELMLRILNNFAYYFGFRTNQNTLSYVNNLKAALYYEVENQIYCISCNGDDLKWESGQGEIRINGDSDPEKLYELTEKYQQQLFYSLIINYALYAYNSNIFKHESFGDVWLDGLFHKNDSYQTPLVVNPMRTNGNIDVNNELHLSRQRLMSIFADAGNDEKKRLVNDRVEAYGFCFKIEEEVKLEKVTLEEYFKEVENDVCTLKDLEGNYSELDAKELLCNFNEFWSSFAPRLYDNPTLVDWLKQNCNHLERREKTDLCKYLEIMVQAKENDVEWMFDLKGYMSYFLPNGGLEWMNYAQFYRLALVFALWDILVKEENLPVEGRIEDYLCCKDEARSKAALYIPYKIMEILTTYPPYFKRHYLYDPLFDRMKERWPSGSVEKDLIEDVREILAKDDYTTLKLHQTINYLRDRDGDMYGAEDCVSTAEGYDKLVTFENLNKEIAQEGQNLSEMVKRLPPPVFEGDIMLKEPGKDMYPLSQISSGMMQRLNSVGALIYHLRNLNYRLKDNKRIEYDYVSVVFEEVELYFHPEYQRTLINYLLKQIERAELKHIKGIHLIYVTHSPFILSDMSKANILYLSKEKKNRPEKETFAANIYDLLDDHFFLEETIGEVALCKINEIVKLYRLDKKSAEREKTFKDHYQEMGRYSKFIGDNYLRKVALQMIVEMARDYKLDDFVEDIEIEQQIREHEDAIRELRRKKGDRYD